MWLLLILGIPAVIILALEIYYYKYKNAINKIPGPKPLPIIGNAHQMGKNPHEILTNLMRWWKENNQQTYRVWIGGYFAYVMVTEPKDMEYILSSNTMIEKSDIYYMLHPWLGQGLLTSTGTHWHKHRKTITPSFHFQVLQHYHEVMNACSNKFMQSLKKISAGDTIFDFQEAAHYMTLDVISETAMGVSINAMDEHDSEVVKAFKNMCYNINMRMYHPWKRYNRLYRFASDYPEYCKTLKVLHDFTNEIIKKRIEELKEFKKNKKLGDNSDEYHRKKLAFLDTLLTAKIDNNPMSQKDIYEEVSTFMFEGHDTTTSGITFAIYLLSRHPKIQQKVFEEQKRVMAGNLNGDATYQEIADMKYLDMVIKEAQRVYPSVPMVSRYADKDQVMNGKFIPDHTVFNIFLIALGYNDKTFPDPYRVDPTRFDLEKNTEKLNPYAYVPFSAGPRNCIGQKFALLELKTVVSKMVRTFEILPPLDDLVSKDGYVQNFLGLSAKEERKRNPNPSKYDPELSTVLTLKSENGIHIRLRERLN